MSVKCIETGIIYPSAADAARAVGITPAAITHQLKGRQKTAGGFTWRKIGCHIVRKKQRRVLYDNLGNAFHSYETIAARKGINKQKAHRWMNSTPDGIFHNHWLYEGVDRITFQYDENLGWVVDGVPYRKRDKAVSSILKRMRNFPAVWGHSKLDKAFRTGKEIVMVFDHRGWVEYNNDLFG